MRPQIPSNFSEIRILTLVCPAPPPRFWSKPINPRHPKPYPPNHNSLLTARGGSPKPALTMRTTELSVPPNVYAAAELGTLSDVPVELLTEEALTNIDEDKGYAPIHNAAMFGYLDQIPEERLTPAVMSAPSLDKLNALHYAAREHHLNQVPKKLLTPELLGDTTHGDWTPAHEIAACGDIGLVPKASLTKEVLTQLANTRMKFLHEPREPAQPVREALTRPEMSVIEVCLRNGSVKAIPRSALTTEVMHANTCSKGATAMHVVAETGCWNSVPAELETSRVAFLRDNMNESPLHYAAKSGKLGEAPPALFWQTTVTHRSDTGNTPLSDAAVYGHISQIPSEFLTRENLSATHVEGKTVYHFLASSGTLGDLPPSALERSDLLRKDKFGATPLHDAALSKKLGKVPRGIVQSEDLGVVDKRGASVETIACSFGCQDQAWEMVGDHRSTPVASLQSLPAEPQVRPASSTSKSIDRIF